MALMVFSVQAQITGVIVDTDSGEPLIGASVLVRGTVAGTITDVDGSFSISSDAGTDCSIEIGYLGFQTIILDVPGCSGNVGNVGLRQGYAGLDEVVITGVMDIVQDRRTPVAVSTITRAEIQAKAGNVEFPELMKSTPSIYVANQAGGYGDSEIFTRGFDQTNTAFLLNGQPINGMEDGKMYWSNWSGMSDVATAIQVQRGLGSSKLAISSVGGTTNIIMKATELEQGGSAGLLYGNDNYLKGTVSYNTGMINDKFGISFLLTHWQGDGWAEGTKGQGQNYFISAGYKVNKKHSLNFLVTGAPQYHDQNFSKRISSHYNDPNNPDEFNIKFNNNYGFLNGEYLSQRRNYYHKPVANINWDWKISDNSSLSTVVYASWGNGGGTGGYGSSQRFIDNGITEDGYINWDAIVDYNATVPDGIGLNRVNGQFVGNAIRGSRNNHSWYGLVSNYNTKLSNTLSLSFGADLRTYRGSHFRELVNLLGLNGFDESDKERFDNLIVSTTFDANPWSAISNSATIDNSIDYFNDETISYAGTFAQLEYSNESISAFVQGALSNQSHVRFELHNELAANEESESVNNLGYNLKTGASYQINNNNIIFVNTGFYERQPFHDNIYLNFSNTVNTVAVPEKIFGLEGGYKYFNQDFALNLNAYYTTWNDRTTTRTLNDSTVLDNGAVIVGQGFRNTLQDQKHIGVELDFNYRINSKFRVKGFASAGDWAYAGTIDSKFFNEDRTLAYESEGEDVDGIKVGGAAQTTFGLGLDYNPISNLKVDVDYNYYNNLYSNISASTESLQLPSFGILDLGVSYNFDLNNNQLLTLRANVFNALGEEYISRAFDAIEADADAANNWNGVNRDNEVTFGKTLTWNVSAKYSF